MKPTLLIMAAGLGSRFGGIKQLAALGPNGEIIMDYSIHDAIAAGFGRIVIVLRRDIEREFHDRIGSRIESVCARTGVELRYAFQSLDDVPFPVPEGRTRPWGTGQAVLCAGEYLNGPFGVVNADDYYGKDAFFKLCGFLNETSGTDFCMVSYALGNTLSDNGGVTRGVCTCENGMLRDIAETREIVKSGRGAAANGRRLSLDTPVSMNMWGLTQAYLPLLEEGFDAFFRGISDPLKDEFILPEHIGTLLAEGRVSVRVLETDAVWYGVTYKEDSETVAGAIRRLVAKGIYRADLYSDLKGE